jgi:hypothetical protein
VVKDNESLRKILAEYEAALGRPQIESSLRAYLSSPGEEPEAVLTVIANAGVPHMPECLVRGAMYVLSEGSLDFASKESATAEFEKCLTGLVKVLKTQSWKRIYLIPYGPTLLSALAKLVIYRVTGLETIDVMHVKGAYFDMHVDVRQLIVDIGS